MHTKRQSTKTLYPVTENKKVCASTSKQLTSMNSNGLYSLVTKACVRERGETSFLDILATLTQKKENCCQEKKYL